jgi:predicted RNA-binding Zn ribbon-like protein
MEPGGRQPAPGALRLVQAFVNSNDMEAQRDEWSTPEGLRAWLIGHDLLESDAPVSAADLGHALEVREALRGLLLANNEGTVDGDAVETLNRSSGRACLLIRFQPDGRAQLEPSATGVDGAIGRILAIVFVAMAEGSWARLKACRNDTCQWAFYDASKNQGGTWCSMAICGSRIKARAYRRRQHAGALLSSKG